jgi:hypothetical protein
VGWASLLLGVLSRMFEAGYDVRIGGTGV